MPSLVLLLVAFADSLRIVRVTAPYHPAAEMAHGTTGRTVWLVMIPLKLKPARWKVTETLAAFNRMQLLNRFL